MANRPDPIGLGLVPSLQQRCELAVPVCEQEDHSDKMEGPTAAEMLAALAHSIHGKDNEAPWHAVLMGTETLDTIHFIRTLQIRSIAYMATQEAFEKFPSNFPHSLKSVYDHYQRIWFRDNLDKPGDFECTRAGIMLSGFAVPTNIISPWGRIALPMGDICGRNAGECIKFVKSMFIELLYSKVGLILHDHPEEPHACECMLQDVLTIPEKTPRAYTLPDGHADYIPDVALISTREKMRRCWEFLMSQSVRIGILDGYGLNQKFLDLDSFTKGFSLPPESLSSSSSSSPPLQDDVATNLIRRLQSLSDENRPEEKGSDPVLPDILNVTYFVYSLQIMKVASIIAKQLAYQYGVKEVFEGMEFDPHYGELFDLGATDDKTYYTNGGLCLLPFHGTLCMLATPWGRIRLATEVFVAPVISDDRNGFIRDKFKQYLGDVLGLNLSPVSQEDPRQTRYDIMTDADLVLPPSSIRTQTPTRFNCENVKQSVRARGLWYWSHILGMAHSVGVVRSRPCWELHESFRRGLPTSQSIPVQLSPIVPPPDLSEANMLDEKKTIAALASVVKTTYAVIEDARTIYASFSILPHWKREFSIDSYFARERDWFTVSGLCILFSFLCAPHTPFPIGFLTPWGAVRLPATTPVKLSGVEQNSCRQYIYESLQSELTLGPLTKYEMKSIISGKYMWYREVIDMPSEFASRLGFSECSVPRLSFEGVPDGGLFELHRKDCNAEFNRLWLSYRDNIYKALDNNNNNNNGERIVKKFDVIEIDNDNDEGMASNIIEEDGRSDSDSNSDIDSDSDSVPSLDEELIDQDSRDMNVLEEDYDDDSKPQRSVDEVWNSQFGFLDARSVNKASEMNVALMDDLVGPSSGLTVNERYHISSYARLEKDKIQPRGMSEVEKPVLIQQRPGGSPYPLTTALRQTFYPVMSGPNKIPFEKIRQDLVNWDPPIQVMDNPMCEDNDAFKCDGMSDESSPIAGPKPGEAPLPYSQRPLSMEDFRGNMPRPDSINITGMAKVEDGLKFVAEYVKRKSEEDQLRREYKEKLKQFQREIGESSVSQSPISFDKESLAAFDQFGADNQDNADALSERLEEMNEDIEEIMAMGELDYGTRTEEYPKKMSQLLSKAIDHMKDKEARDKMMHSFVHVVMSSPGPVIRKKSLSNKLHDQYNSPFAAAQRVFGQPDLSPSWDQLSQFWNPFRNLAPSAEESIAADNLSELNQQSSVVPEKEPQQQQLSLVPHPAAVAAAAAADAAGELRDDRECIICYERQYDTLFLPCKHMACCSVCSANAALKECPKCRMTIAQKISGVYFG